MKHTIKIKRVYDLPDPKDGKRILVDRLWPRGLTKEKAHVDVWLKEVAPSTELRQWFHHEEGKWSDFSKRYRTELKKNPAPLAELKKMAAAESITLLYSAKDVQFNQAVILKDLLSAAYRPSPKKAVTMP